MPVNQILLKSYAIPGDDHYDIGEDIEGLSYASTGIASGEGNANNESVNDWISWSGMTGQADGGQFNRWVSHYSSTAWTSGGIAIASGHANTSDPLAARDVGFYYSTDTTNGTNGSWNIITPKNMVVAHCKKHSAASGYVGNRTSTIDSNHVKLSGNTIKEGWEGWQSRNNAYIYNRGNMNNGEQDSGNIFDVITWDPIPNVKGIRLDVRTKWDNGHYSGEKPHVAEIRHFKAPVDGINETPDTEMESDSNCMCYCDPKNVSGNNLPDSSGSNYAYTLSGGGTVGTWTYNSGNGGILTSSSGALRNGNAVGRNSKNSFSFGVWVRINNADGGIIWHGEQAARQHCCIRNNIGQSNAFNIGCDIEGGDYWDQPHVEDVRADYYVENLGHTVGTTWHFFALRSHGTGLIETTFDGKPFELQKHTRNTNMNSSMSSPFGIGGDVYNDNYSSHSYGPFWFYSGLVPYYRIRMEWNRLKTRFGR